MLGNGEGGELWATGQIAMEGKEEADWRRMQGKFQRKTDHL